MIQVDGKTIYCKPESNLDESLKMTMELMELASYLGIIAGTKHEQDFMGGRTLKNLDETKEVAFIVDEG